MTENELHDLIAAGETLTVEFKSDREKLSDRALVEALAAMANTDGGVLILGVEDKTGIRVWLIANGTIKRAKICELCDVSTKQAKTIIDSFCKKYSVSVQGAGRSTTYKWND